MKTETKPWYAHEFPDRPLVEGTHLCCCIPCAVSLERAGMEDARRPVFLHTGDGIHSYYTSYLFWRRSEGQLHDVFLYEDGARINWVNAIEVGPRRGRGKRGWRDEDPYPRPLADWPICPHCGPLSSATFADLAGTAPTRKPSTKARAAAESSMQARIELEAKVLVAVEEQIDRALLANALRRARIDAGDYSWLDTPPEYPR